MADLNREPQTLKNAGILRFEGEKIVLAVDGKLVTCGTWTPNLVNFYEGMKFDSVHLVWKGDEENGEWEMISWQVANSDPTKLFK